MNKAVKDAIGAAERAKAEVSRVSDAVEIHETKLEGLRAGLVSPPDRSGELADVLAAQALGEATAADVARLRKAIEAEQAASDKRNQSDKARIVEIEQQLNGLRVRLERAHDAEHQAHRALHDAALGEISARLRADSAKLLEHLKALGELLPRLLADCMLLDQTDRAGRFDGLRSHMTIDISAWPPHLAGSPSDEEIYACSEHGTNRAAHDLFQAAIAELAGVGVELRA